MSTVSRIVSGSAASWSQLSVTFVAQIFLVPVFLGQWQPSTYGVWIGVFALATLTRFLDLGHHNYVGFEALRLGAQSRAEIATLYKSASAIALWIGAIELLAVTALVYSGWHMLILGAGGDSDGQLARHVGILLVLPSASWLLFGNWSSVAGRVLVPFGYYPQIAWWQVVGTIVTALAPAVAVSLGAGLLTAGVVYHIAHAIYAAAAVFYLQRMIERESINTSRANYSYGLSNYLRSLALSFRIVMEMFRQEHFRLFLAPLVGAANLVLFVTTRTVTNVLMTGLATVTGPSMPELLRYLTKADTAKSVSVMSIVWLILVAILAPAAVAAQLFMPPLFKMWTRNRVPFDPTLFGLLSISVLLFALAQPALSVVQGLNILRPQVAISFCATSIALVGTLYFAPRFGVKGAAAALLVSELFVSISSLVLMRRVFGSLNMMWPKKPVAITVFAVSFSSVLIVAASRTESNAAFVLVAAVAGAAVASAALLKSLPRGVRSLAVTTIAKAIRASGLQQVSPV